MMLLIYLPTFQQTFSVLADLRHLSQCNGVRSSRRISGFGYLPKDTPYILGHVKYS